MRRRVDPIFVAFLLFLAWLPIPLGSNRPWSSALLVAGALSLFAVSLFRALRAQELAPGTFTDLRVEIGLLCTWLLYLLIQAVPLPPGLLEALSPGVFELYREAGVTPGRWAPLSVDRGATLVQLLYACSYVAVLALVVMFVDSMVRLRTLCLIIVAVGLAEAVYGLMVYFDGGGLGLWDPRTYGRSESVVSGTYVNRNHFAGLMIMCIPVCLGLSMGMGGIRSGSVAARVTAVFLDGRGVLFLCALVMLAALLLSTSRGGMGALAAALVCVTLLSILMRGRNVPEARLLPRLLVLVLAAVLWLGVGGTKDKLLAVGLDSNRADIRGTTYQMIGDNALFGSGAGTYQWQFPSYKDEKFGLWLYDHAHNDYLELLSDQGTIGFALFIVAVILMLERAVRGYRVRRNRFVRGVLFGVLVGAASFLIHAWVDFNFQIPANAVYFFVLLSLGVVAARLEEQTGDRN